MSMAWELNSNTRLRLDAQFNRREQLDAVGASVLKLQMMGLTPENGMVECPPPRGINPFRWKAMVIHAFKMLDKGE